MNNLLGLAEAADVPGRFLIEGEQQQVGFRVNGFTGSGDRGTIKITVYESTGEPVGGIVIRAQPVGIAPPT
ncbi:hypothetical protein [Subtercola vilae]|uniref:hypothetical protein n=1 Tax=Subtercola vilae TaxID=2056433 RepID=UPI0010AAD81D|nr:hypothetical protein [Subtercola vilae]